MHSSAGMPASATFHIYTSTKQTRVAVHETVVSRGVPKDYRTGEINPEVFKDAGGLTMGMLFDIVEAYAYLVVNSGFWIQWCNGNCPILHVRCRDIVQHGRKLRPTAPSCLASEKKKCSIEDIFGILNMNIETSISTVYCIKWRAGMNDALGCGASSWS